MSEELKHCSVDDCGKPQKQKDGKYCSMHRARLSRTGRLDKKSAREKLRECPFCGATEKDDSYVDAEGWLDNSGKRGPECLRCGATALTIKAWNTRTNTQEVEQLRKSHAIELQCLMEEKDNEVSQLRNELEEWKKIDAADVKYLTEKREEGEQERDELTAYVNLIQIGVDDVSCVTDAMLLVKIIREGMPPLDGLPAQSLQAHDNEIIERCAQLMDGSPFCSNIASNSIRKLKDNG